MYILHEKKPQKPPEHTSEHVKSQNFLGACPQTPLKQSIAYRPHFLYLPWAPTIVLAALNAKVLQCCSYFVWMIPSIHVLVSIILACRYHA